MKLKSLELGQAFRSLPAGFKLVFREDWDDASNFRFEPFCFAGPNGSGKSNVLEVLSAIFFHLECMYLDYRPIGFEYDEASNPQGFRPEKSNPDAFIIEYLIPVDVTHQFEENNVAHVRVKKSFDEPPVFEWLNRDTKQTPDLSRSVIKSILPTFIVGYSSGTNEVLSLPFIKMRLIGFDEYIEHLTRSLPYGGGPEGRMIYLDEQFSQAVMLTHFIFPNDRVLSAFQDKVGLLGIRRFRIIIRRFHRLEVRDAETSFIGETNEEYEPETVELTSNFSSRFATSDHRAVGLIDKLTRCASSSYEDYQAYTDGTSFDLYLDFLINDATRDAFKAYFGVGSVGGDDERQEECSINLFRALLALLMLNNFRVDSGTKAELYRSESLYANETLPTLASDERIMRFKDFELRKRGISGPILGKSLSDGEHQLLHTIGLCLLFRHKPALFLLDEPETHLNPDWRASYLSLMGRALDNNGVRRPMPEVLLTSHSPFVISDCPSNRVLIFRRDSSGQVEYTRPDFNTFGASANAITVKVFGQTETIGDHALEAIAHLDQRLSSGESAEELIDLAAEYLGDSVERSLFIGRALKMQGE